MFVDLDRRLHFEILKAFVPTHNVWGRPAQRATVRSGAVDAAVIPLVLNRQRCSDLQDCGGAITCSLISLVHKAQMIYVVK